jgi:hypothetical protein
MPVIRLTLWRIVLRMLSMSIMSVCFLQTARHVPSTTDGTAPANP